MAGYGARQRCAGRVRTFAHETKIRLTATPAPIGAELAEGGHAGRRVVYGQNLNENSWWMVVVALNGAATGGRPICTPSQGGHPGLAPGRHCF